MYIRKIELENIKNFSKFTWQLAKKEDPAGWHVLLGENGTGKSSLIRAAAIALMGLEEAPKTRQPFNEWVRHGKEAGYIRLGVIQNHRYDFWTGKGNILAEDLNFAIKIQKTGELTHQGTPNPNRYLWKGKGWFSASYGPFRSFSGGNNDYQKLFYSAPLLARHLSVFGEDIALTETVEWLQSLRFKQLENQKSPEDKLLTGMIEYLNQNGLLPNQAKIKEVTSEGIFFIDGFGHTVDIEALSDGYRSVLSILIELIRQMVNCYGIRKVFNRGYTRVTCPGVVFIDEIDVHLHPQWQREIGQWLTKHFPKIQFIVSSHSPLVCQNASSGSIWRLPHPTTSEQKGRIRGVALNRLLYGNILEGLSSGAFGQEINRSDQGLAMLEELAELNIMAQTEELTKKEKKRREELLQIFPVHSSRRS